MRTALVGLLVLGVMTGCMGLSDPAGQQAACAQQTDTGADPTRTRGTSSGPADYSELTGGIGGEGYVPADTYDGSQPALVPGKDVQATFDVSNREGEQTDYTIVVQLQGYSYDGADDRTPTVTNRTTLTRWSVTVPDGERTETNGTFTVPNASGTHHRLAILLYDCEPPSTPTTEYTVTEPWYIGVNVTSAADSAAAIHRS